MVRKTKEEAQETRQNILNAALDIFYEKGVSKSSLEDIADAAGVTRGAVYWHFKNKIDLFTALHTRVHTPLLGKMADAPKNDELSPLEHLRGFCIDVFTSIVNEPAQRKFFTVFFLKCDYSGDLADLLVVQNAQKKESLILTQSFFRRAIERKFISDKNDPDLLGVSLYCYIGGILHEYLRNPTGEMDINAVKALIDIFFNNLR